MEAWTLAFRRKVLAAAVAGKVTLPTPDGQGWKLLCKPESSAMSKPAPIVRIAKVLDAYFATAGPQAEPDLTSLDLLVARVGATLSEDVAAALYQEWQSRVRAGDPRPRVCPSGDRREAQTPAFHAVPREGRR